MKPSSIALAFTLALMLQVDRARADGFADAGSVQLGVDRVMGVFFQRQSQKTDAMGVSSESTNKYTTVGVLAMNGETAASVPRLALDYFLAPNISVGGSFVYVTQSASNVFSSDNNPDDTESDLGSRSIFALHPRAGYALGLSDSWGIWPRAGLLFANQSLVTPETVNPDGSVTETTDSAATLSLTLDGMFYATPVEHFIVMGGPFLDLGVWGSGSRETEGSPSQDFDAGLTAFGLSFALGAYF